MLVFKHSTRCNISAAALNRLERSEADDSAGHPVPYLLDLLSYRNLSALLADEYGVAHESPQVLLIYKGRAVYNASHMAIRYPDILAHTPAAA